MLIHIVRHNEKIEDILEAYHVTFDEVKVNNLHVTDFKKLVGGVKLKIPFLSVETKQILEETETFISDYYPALEKIDSVIKNAEVAIEEIHENDLFEKKIEEEITEKQEIKKEEKINTSQNVGYMNPNMKYVRSRYGIPVPFPQKSIYPHYINKDKK